MTRKILTSRMLATFALLALPATLYAHGVSGKDAGFIEQVQGVAFAPFLYLGAKHMVTGYDHLLFLAGVIFFLVRLRDVALYASLFALGHSLTLLSAVMFDWRADAHLVDAVIGLSVAYKGFENLGGFRAFGWEPDTRLAVLGFGLVHGFGLATKLQELSLSRDGLFANLVGFNLGVECGQLVALTLMVIAFGIWRGTTGFTRHARAANMLLLILGFVLAGEQLAGYLTP